MENNDIPALFMQMNRYIRALKTIRDMEGAAHDYIRPSLVAQRALMKRRLDVVLVGAEKEDPICSHSQ